MRNIAMADAVFAIASDSVFLRKFIGQTENGIHLRHVREKRAVKNGILRSVRHHLLHQFDVFCLHRIVQRSMIAHFNDFFKLFGIDFCCASEFLTAGNDAMAYASDFFKGRDSLSLNLFDNQLASTFIR